MFRLGKHTWRGPSLCTLNHKWYLPTCRTDMLLLLLLTCCYCRIGCIRSHFADRILLDDTWLLQVLFLNLPDICPQGLGVSVRPCFFLLQNTVCIVTIKGYSFSPTMKKKTLTSSRYGRKHIQLNSVYKYDDIQGKRPKGLRPHLKTKLTEPRIQSNSSKGSKSRQ